MDLEGCEIYVHRGCECLWKLEGENMNANIKVGFAVILLGSVFGLSSNAEAGVECTLRLGNDCSGTVIFKLEMCKNAWDQNAIAISKCEKLCRRSKPVCNVEDFDGWVKADHERGNKDGLTGELASNADSFDDEGVLLYSSEKTFTVCGRSRSINPLGFMGTWSKWLPANSPVVCPKAKGASPDTCVGGTVFDATKKQCVIQDPSCGGGGSSDVSAMINQSIMLTTTQNNHFGLESEMSTKAPQYASTGGTQMPGLTAPTRLNSNSENASGSNGKSSKTASNSSVSSGSSAGPGMLSSTGGALETSDGSNAKNTNGAENNAVLASSLLGTQDGTGSAGGSGHGGASGSSTGTSWFSGGSVTPSSDSANGTLSFQGTADGDTSRGLAANGNLSIEDPANYFMMSDIDVSLFKRVTAQCRKKEKSLVSRVATP